MSNRGEIHVLLISFVGVLDRVATLKRLLLRLLLALPPEPQFLDPGLGGDFKTIIAIYTADYSTALVLVRFPLSMLRSQLHRGQGRRFYLSLGLCMCGFTTSP